MDIRLVLGVALKIAATSFVLAHNHPSGNLSPSEIDKQITNRLNKAAQLLDIRLKDHLIISAVPNYFSFADKGLL